MKVLLINIDSKIPNLALAKIEKYHRDRGDEIIYDFPLAKYQCDKIYVSCVFTVNKDQCTEWEGVAEIGGTGYDIHKKLPPEIEAVKPRINWGFTTRGCIRKCRFCFVPEKEGKLHIVGDIYDIWDSKSKNITLMDNNILGLSEHFKKICNQLRKEKLRVDFNQGLDHRLLTEDICTEILSLKHKSEIRFSFDYLEYKPTVLRAISLLNKAGLKDWGSRWYVYVSPEDTYETVYQRIELLRYHKQLCYIMRDREVYTNKSFIALSQWTNSVSTFKYPLREAIQKSEKLTQYAQYFEL